MTFGIALGTLRRGLVHVAKSFERFIDAEAYRLAASLSFYALSSLLPLLLLAISVGDALLGDSRELRQSLIAVLNVTDSPALREIILGALEGAQGSSQRTGWGIALGLVFAAIGASGIFLELDAAMEKLFLVAPIKRSPLQHVRLFLRDRAAALLLVMGTCLLVLFGAVALASLEVLATFLRVPADTWPGAATYLVTLGLMIAALTLCYKVVPAPRVQIRAALAGAVFATLGLTLARLPLSWGIAHLTSYSTYGVVGALLVLVTWFYVASCVLLLGAALAACSNESRRHASPEDQRHHGQDQENHEQDLRDTGCAGSNAAKPEDRSKQRNDEKYGSPVQHDDSSIAHSSARAGG